MARASSTQTVDLALHVVPTHVPVHSNRIRSKQPQKRKAEAVLAAFHTTLGQTITTWVANDRSISIGYVRRMGRERLSEFAAVGWRRSVALPSRDALSVGSSLYALVRLIDWGLSGLFLSRERESNGGFFRMIASAPFCLRQCVSGFLEQGSRWGAHGGERRTSAGMIPQGDGWMVAVLVYTFTGLPHAGACVHARSQSTT